MAIATIDYSSIKKDLTEQARSFMLSQYHYAISPVLDALLQVYISEIQELYDAIVALMEQRSLAKAKGTNLDEIGHIVGRDRTIFNYEISFWFAPDMGGVQPDNGHWWCQNAEQAVAEKMDDETYRKWIWMQILENHNLFSSVPELENAIYDGIGEIVGIERGLTNINIPHEMYEWDSSFGKAYTDTREPIWGSTLAYDSSYNVLGTINMTERWSGYITIYVGELGQPDTKNYDRLFSDTSTVTIYEEKQEKIMSAKLYVQSQISLTNKNLLSYNKDTELTDNDYLFAYPAPTSITEIEEV